MPLVPPVLYRRGSFQITQSVATMVLFALLMLVAAMAMIKSRKDPVEQERSASPKESAIARLLLYGVLVGTATGFLGAGGGFLIIPALVLMLKMPMKEAVGTSLLIIALNSLIGFTGDIGHFNINWNFLLLITGVAVIGIFIGGFLARKMNGEKLKRTFGWFVLFMGIYILIKELFFH
jgi:hypothetical protein